MLKSPAASGVFQQVGFPPDSQTVRRSTSSNGLGGSDTQSAPPSFLNEHADIIGLGMAMAW